jgi:thymidylate kinase
MESVGIDFFQNIRKGYHQIMEQNQSRCILISGEQSQENVFKEINQLIMKRFKGELACSN